MRDDGGSEGMQRYGPFELRDGENLLSIEDIRYSPADAQVSCYNTVFRVKVVSGEFAGAGEFECDWTEFLRFVSELNELYDFRRDEAELRDIEWGSWLRFLMNKVGSLTISGHLYGAAAQTLDFSLETDQTALQSFLQQIMKQLS